MHWVCLPVVLDRDCCAILSSLLLQYIPAANVTATAFRVGLSVCAEATCCAPRSCQDTIQTDILVVIASILLNKRLIFRQSCLRFSSFDDMHQRGSGPDEVRRGNKRQLQ